MAAIGLVTFSGIRSKALDAKVKADLNAIKKAYEANYDPTANNGQGGYKPLQDSQFAGGKIPVQPNGSPYPCSIGPDSAGTASTYGCSTTNAGGYQVTGTLSDNSTTSVISNQGTLPASQLSSCDPSLTLANGLTAYWKMDETTNSWNGTAGEVKDTLGISNGTSVNITAGSSPNSAKINNGANFTGQIGNSVTTNKYVQMARNSSLEPLSAISISLWFKSAGQLSGIYGRMLSYASAYEIVMYPSAAGNKIQFLLNTTGPASGQKNIVSNSPLADNNWHHMVSIWDGTTMQMYIDGALQASTASATGAITYSGTGSVRIGAQGGSSTTTSWPYTGMVDDIRIYNRALSQAEVSLLNSLCVSP